MGFKVCCTHPTSRPTRWCALRCNQQLIVTLVPIEKESQCFGESAVRAQYPDRRAGAPYMSESVLFGVSVKPKTLAGMLYTLNFQTDSLVRPMSHSGIKTSSWKGVSRVKQPNILRDMQGRHPQISWGCSFAKLVTG